MNKQTANMMDDFRVAYIPGGMGLNHSAWWLVKRVFIQGVYVDLRMKMLRRADYA